MSAAACKAAICNNNAAATAEVVVREARRGNFTDEQLEELTHCADKFVKDVLAIVQSE